MAAAAAGAVALNIALNLWGLVELEKLAYAASLTPFIPAGVKEYSREEALRILREAPTPMRGGGESGKRWGEGEACGALGVVEGVDYAEAV